MVGLEKRTPFSLIFFWILKKYALDWIMYPLNFTLKLSFMFSVFRNDKERTKKCLNSTYLNWVNLGLLAPLPGALLELFPDVEETVWQSHSAKLLTCSADIVNVNVSLGHWQWPIASFRQKIHYPSRNWKLSPDYLLLPGSLSVQINCSHCSL